VSNTISREARRDEVAVAVRTCIARDGLANTTMRSIARELGTTTGFLSHYFSNKEDILGFALGSVVGRITERIEPYLTKSPTMTNLIGALSQALPLDDERRLEGLVWMSSLGAVSGDDQIVDNLRRSYTEVSTELQAFANASRADADLPALPFEQVIAMLDGLTIQALLLPERFPPKRQRALLREFIQHP